MPEGWYEICHMHYGYAAVPFDPAYVPTHWRPTPTPPAAENGMSIEWTAAARAQGLANEAPKPALARRKL